MALNWIACAFSGWSRSASEREPTRGSATRPASSALEAQLAAALAENARLELLLGSTRHSVGNHLALLSAMLARQGRATNDAETRAAFLTATSRVATIAEMMRSERLSGGERVDARDLVGRVLRPLSEAAAGIGVSLEVEVGTFALTADEALPFVVILDELVVNSLKHAFPGQIGGVIRVGFRETAGPLASELSLSVEDDGVGMAPCVSSPRFGAKVISSMVKTLGATMTESPRSARDRPGLRTIVAIQRK